MSIRLFIVESADISGKEEMDFWIAIGLIVVSMLALVIGGYDQYKGSTGRSIASQYPALNI